MKLNKKIVKDLKDIKNPNGQRRIKEIIKLYRRYWENTNEVKEYEKIKEDEAMDLLKATFISAIIDCQHLSDLEALKPQILPLSGSILTDKYFTEYL